jgi:polysaccharide pyruvyl transferase WcaK-like protein
VVRRPTRPWLGGPARPGEEDDRPPGPRVALVGLLASGNTGNAACTTALVEHLRAAHPGVRLSAISEGPDVVRRRYGIPAASLTWERLERAEWPRPVRLVAKAAAKLVLPLRACVLLRRVDLVVVPGMGVLEDTLPIRPWGFPYSLWAVASAARLTRTPVALVAVGATRPRNRLTRRFVRRAARVATYRSFRDPASRDALRALGVDTADDRVVPDLAFALPTPAPPTVREDEDVTVAVGVLDYRGRDEDRHRADALHESYLARTCALLCGLLDEGYTVRLVTGAPAGVGVVARLKEHVARERPQDTPRVVFAPTDSVTDVMAQLATVDAVVASRFHNVLSALRTARPTVSLGYAGKHRALMEAMGVGEYCREVDTFEVGDVLALVRRALDETDRLVPLLRARDARAVARLADQWADLDRLLGSPAVPAPRPTPGGRAARRPTPAYEEPES